MKLVAGIVSWMLYTLAVLIGLPSLAGAHVSEVLSDLADELWEKR